ncbi:MAG: two-component system, OmpR family, response regulator RegX3, partial [Actinomycetota bacterium]|nr:two-component system, OmpR family, response regulator RegX3 [Actinomycetota bacterium]
PGPRVARWKGDAVAASILIVEDEPSLAETLSYNLSREGYRVSIAADGREGLREFRTEIPSLVILDLMLPEVSGFDLCRLIRAESSVPIIITTAKDSEADKVAGLELGADDYMTKPFSCLELVARVRALLRRAGGTRIASVNRDPGLPAVLTSGEIALDADRHEVSLRGEPIPLPPKEFQLLEVLLRGRGRLLTRERIIEEVWGPDYVGDTKTLDVHVKRLRRRIELDPHSPSQLVTVRGLGYRLLG